MTKQLSRLAVQRMVGGRKSGAGGGGGGGGGASQGWVENNYLSKAFFNQLFEAHVTTSAQEYDENGQPVGDPVITTGVVMAPNDVPTTTTEIDPETEHTTVTTYTITDLQVKTGLWTNSFVSALGQSQGGGGAATTLYDLLDVSIPATMSQANDGQVLMYSHSQGKWINGDVQSGSGSVTSVALTVPTGFNINGSPITNSGTLSISFASGYSLPLITDVNKGVTAYNWGDHANAGYLTGITSLMITTALGYTPIGNGTTFWGQSINNNKVKGSIAMDKGDIISFDSKNALQYDYSNSLLTLGYGFRNTCPTQVYGTVIRFLIGTTVIVSITSDGLRIGDGLISWDSVNNALKVQKADGTAANFYATGGVSALGTS